MKYYIVAGEVSGDLHGSGLVRELIILDPDASFRGNGGDMMKREGVDIVNHIRDLDFMGFWEILVNLRKIFSFINTCKSDIERWKPDAVILIDYPGFNLRIAEFAKKKGIKVFYYVSPQIWAWKQGRISRIKRFVDHLFVILPFEKLFYERFGYKVDFVGHPLLDAIGAIQVPDEEYFLTSNGLENKPVIALLPGSRKQEIRRLLPVMLKVIGHFEKDFQFVVAGTTSVSPDYYRKKCGNIKIPVIYDQTYSLMKHSFAALITSGTATLEAALFKLPQVVCYKANPVSYFIAKRLVHLKFISLVNLILEKEVVKELIQKNMNEANAVFYLKEIISDRKKREQISADYVELGRKLGGKGASRTTAELILEYSASL